MKVIKYFLCTEINNGSQEAPELERILSPVEMGWNEANEEIAKREAFNGEYTVEEVNDVEPVPVTQEERIAELEEALAMLLSGVTE